MIALKQVFIAFSRSLNIKSEHLAVIKVTVKEGFYFFRVVMYAAYRMLITNMSKGQGLIGFNGFKRLFVMNFMNQKFKF